MTSGAMTEEEILSALREANTVGGMSDGQMQTISRALGRGFSATRENVDALAANMTTRFAEVTTRFSEVFERLESMDEKITGIEEELGMANVYALMLLTQHFSDNDQFVGAFERAREIKDRLAADQAGESS